MYFGFKNFMTYGYSVNTTALYIVDILHIWIIFIDKEEKNLLWNKLIIIFISLTK